ncbi:MAG TPA: hypothetical protein VIL65_08450 [Beijerinckiaceae bacterium]|jgi:hypothetical protein
MFGALLPRIEGRSRLGQAGEVTYLWLNLMAAAVVLSAASGALGLGGAGSGFGFSTREMLVLWMFAALALRAPALLTWWITASRTRERSQPATREAEAPRGPATAPQTFASAAWEPPSPKARSTTASRSRYRERG